ncbi:hypothetical protein PILCRDRAFT_494768 [Piloderma croceum F 1598]|uniref:Uncharacterized protein n=1 Tax=Piloderma croceum (strain F 1598) TaxID=765440 RepID=A0A0C3FA31_PILCF|nr:hypothetical protein PILCRDRAFT_494768 [Piloderma croceum F 1598]
MVYHCHHSYLLLAERSRVIYLRRHSLGSWSTLIVAFRMPAFDHWSPRGCNAPPPPNDPKRSKANL